MQKFATAKKEILPNVAAKQIFDLIKPELALVEAEFEEQARSNIQVVDFLGDYLRASGGKRVRPALLILSTYVAGGLGKSENVIRMASVMEMLHTATLVHDDIIDNADLRRNRSSVNAKYGNQTAVLMGDWLYMTAFETSLRERSLEILDILTRLTRKMTEGELIQLTLLGNVDITREEYFDVLRRKTAYLFSGCCEIGAILGKCDRDKQVALKNFGMDLGIAFQLADDLLDLTSDNITLGKKAGSDLIEGKVTMPLLILAEESPSVKGVLEEIMASGEYPESAKKHIDKLLIDNDIYSKTREVAVSYAESAIKNLDIFAKSEYLNALRSIPSFVIDRNK